jgi:toxin-antitoxin system PIN domain toxin
MRLVDVNVLVYASRGELEHHKACLAFVEDMVNGDETYAVTDFVMTGFVRVVTNPRIFRTPTPLDRALTFAEQVRNQPHAVVVNPGGRHWDVFSRLCRQVGGKGGVISDAYLAAVAIEHGCELVTVDRDFARFPSLRHRSPLDA